MSTVIGALRWKNRVTGQTASIYGAVPWTSLNDKLNWAPETVGFTVLHPDGTTGIGRKPFETRVEAQAWCDANPSFRGMSQG